MGHIYVGHNCIGHMCLGRSLSSTSEGVLFKLPRTNLTHLYTYGLNGYGLHMYGKCADKLYSYGLYGHGPCSYGLHSYEHTVMHCIVMAYMFVAWIIMAVEIALPLP